VDGVDRDPAIQEGAEKKSAQYPSKRVFARDGNIIADKISDSKIYNIQGSRRSLDEVVKTIGARNDKGAYQEFGRYDLGSQVTIIHELSLVKSCEIFALLSEDNLARAVRLTDELDSRRAADMLAASKIPIKRVAGILAELPDTRARDILSLIGRVEGKRAARILENMVHLGEVSDGQSGVLRAITIIPINSSDREFLAEISESGSARVLLESMRREYLLEVLLRTPRSKLHIRISQAPSASFEALGLKEMRSSDVATVSESLLKLDSGSLASLFQEVDPRVISRIATEMPPARVVDVLSNAKMTTNRGAAILDEVCHPLAAEILGGLSGDDAFRYIISVKRKTAVALTKELIGGKEGTLREIIQRMTKREAGRFLFQLGISDYKVAVRFRNLLPVDRRFGYTGFPRVDALLISPSILASRSAGESLDPIVDWHSLGYWRSLVLVTKPSDYRRQRNVLLVAFVITLPVLVILSNYVLKVPASSPDPIVHSSPSPAGTSQPGVLSRPSGGLAAHRLYELSLAIAMWPESTCGEWRSSDFSVTESLSNVTGYRVSCSVVSDVEARAIFAWYPPTVRPDGDRIASGRPTNLDNVRIVTELDGSSEMRRWSGPSLNGMHHGGSYIRYVLDDAKSAIWLEMDDLPVALMLHGPDGDTDSFAELEKILLDCGYVLD
jgi:hypothetical protein